MFINIADSGSLHAKFGLFSNTDSDVVNSTLFPLSLIKEVNQDSRCVMNV